MAKEVKKVVKKAPVKSASKAMPAAAKKVAVPKLKVAGAPVAAKVIAEGHVADPYLNGSKHFIIDVGGTKKLFLVGDNYNPDDYSKKYPQFQYQVVTIIIDNVSVKGMTVGGELPDLKTLNSLMSLLDCDISFALYTWFPEMVINVNQYLKFRSDLAKVIFLTKKPGLKLAPGGVIDVRLANGSDVIIKSYSPISQTVYLSDKQWANPAKKFAVKINSDPAGLNIVQASFIIKDNPDFKKYIADTYSRSQFDYVKYAMNDAVDFTDQLGKLTLPSNVQYASLEVKLAGPKVALKK